MACRTHWPSHPDGGEVGAPSIKRLKYTFSYIFQVLVRRARGIVLCAFFPRPVLSFFGQHWYVKGTESMTGLNFFVTTLQTLAVGWRRAKGPSPTLMGFTRRNRWRKRWQPLGLALLFFSFAAQFVCCAPRAIFFDELGGGLGNGTPWVELKDDLTASLL